MNAILNCLLNSVEELTAPLLFCPRKYYLDKRANCVVYEVLVQKRKKETADLACAAACK